MFQIAEGYFSPPSPVVAGFDVFKIKGEREICDHILV